MIRAYSKVAISATALFAALSMSAFRASNGELLHSISSANDKTVITYNADKSIAKLVTTHNSGEDAYSDVRMPVYQNGQLVKTMTTAEGATTPTLFSSFAYNNKGQIDKISYYEGNEVAAYDSLVYDAKAQLTGRYFFVMPTGKNTFENHYCQLYTWDQKGNIIEQENMGRASDNVAFIRSSVVSYKYDDKRNSQHSIAGFAYITELSAGTLSANNMLSEVITAGNGNHVISNSFAYAYNNAQYPERVTVKNSGTQQELTTDYTFE